MLAAISRSSSPNAAGKWLVDIEFAFHFAAHEDRHQPISDFGFRRTMREIAGVSVHVIDEFTVLPVDAAAPQIP